MDRKTLILGGVLIALIAFAYAYQGPLKKWQGGLGKPKNFLAGLDTDKIDKIEFSKNGQTTILNKQDDKWKIAGAKDFFAEGELVSGLLNGLGESGKQTMELVSNSKDKQSEFGLDQGVNLKLYAGDKKVADFIIGKLSSDYSSTYLTKPDLSSIFSIKTDLASNFLQRDWRDLTIFSSDQTKINKIRLQYPNREFSLEKKDGQWSGILPWQFSVNQDKINKILEIMSNLESVKIPEQNFSGAGLDKHLIIVEATGEGVSNTLMIGAADKDGYYFAKRGDSDNIYLITKEERDELDKKIEQLK